MVTHIGIKCLKYALHFIQKSIGNRCIRQGRINQRHSIESLLILTPAYITNMASIIQNKSLATQFSYRIGKTLVRYISLIELGDFRIKPSGKRRSLPRE